MTHTTAAVSALRFGLLALVLTALLPSHALAAREGLRAYQIPAGDAVETLKTFSAQSARELVYRVDQVRGVQTNAVQGEYAAATALAALLDGTALDFAEDADSGAFAVSRRAAAERAQAASAGPAGGAVAADGPAIQMSKYEVTGSKLDGLINKGLLQSGENAPLYHRVVDRTEIERLGISSIEELFRHIPQTSSASTSLQEPAGNTTFSGGLTNRFSTVSLRGFSSSQTVILINGRALPRTSTGANGGADLDRIPIAAIERVEVLPYAGSAIYGAGAIGGAINIILRKDYNGSDVTVYAGTSTNGGASEYRITYLQGLTFNEGRSNVTLTFSYHHRDPLHLSERDYLDEAYRRYGPGTTVTNAQGISAFEQYILPGFTGDTPVLRVFAPNDPTLDLGIPGVPGARYAAIPRGTAPGTALTPESFTETADTLYPRRRYGRSVLYEPIDSYNLNAQIEHQLIKDRLDAYVEFTAGYSRKDYSFPQVLSLDLSETDPMNPFRTDVTPGFVGRPVTVYFDSVDLPDPSALYESESLRAVVGLKGKLSEKWEWSVDGTYDAARANVFSNNPPDNATSLNALTQFSDPGPLAPADVRRAIYPLLSDHLAYPVGADVVATYFDQIRFSRATSSLYEANARLTGEVYALRPGPVRVSAFGKYRTSEYTSEQVLTGSDAWSDLIHGVPFENEFSETESTRDTWQGAVEIDVPIIGQDWHPLGLAALNVQGSASYEGNDSGGINANTNEAFTNTKGARSYVGAFKLQANRDLAVRGSYSEGFYPPDWSDVSDPVSTFTIGGFFPDSARGNTLQFIPFQVVNGGNPDLRPERSKSLNLGVILTPRFVPGLSLSVDFWETKKKDAIAVPVFINALARASEYASTITRLPATPEEEAKGWAGVVTKVDQRRLNLGRTETRGVDFQIHYSRETGIGRFDLNSNASFVDEFLEQVTAASAATDLAGGAGPVRWRGLSSVTWSRNRWTVTVTGRYHGHYSTATTAPSFSYPGAHPIDGYRIPGFTRWDLQFSYEVPYGATPGPRWLGWATGTKWTLGALNVLDDEPSFVSNGSSFYNSADDPRQRFVYLSLRKSL